MVILIPNSQSQEQHYSQGGYDSSMYDDYEDDSDDRYGAHSRDSKQHYENGNAYGPGHYQYGHSSFGDDVQLDDDDDDNMWWNMNRRRPTSSCIFFSHLYFFVFSSSRKYPCLIVGSRCS